MPQTTRPTGSHAHRLIFVVSLVIVSFLAAHLVVAATAKDMTARANAIHVAADESAKLLRVQSDLHAMAFLVIRARDDGFDRISFDDRHRDATEQLASLHDDAITAAVTDAATSLLAGDPPDVTSPLLERADHLLESAVLVRAETTKRESTAITTTQDMVGHRAPLLHVAAAVFGILALAFAVAAATREQRLTEERNAAVAERALELEAFAGRVAHDLKNPLQTLALRAGVLRARVDPALRAHVDGVSTTVKRMNEMIEALLEFARTCGRVNGRAQTDVAAMLGPILDDFRNDAAAASVEITVANVDSAMVDVPPGVVGCVIGNLVRNAVKFIADAPTDDRRIDVRVIPGHDGFVAIHVDDTGPGIPPGMERQIFEPFVRASSTRPGLGLGLATVKRLVESYGGSVIAKAHAPHGASFIVDLPVGGNHPPSL